MSSFRKTAASNVHFEGGTTHSTLNTVILNANNNVDPYARQRYLAKNYCDHTPSAPKLFESPPEHKKRSLVVQKIGKYLNDSYFCPKRSLLSLQINQIKNHRIRSQRREAAISLLLAMNYYQDDATLRVGRLLADGTFRSISLKKLAIYARINFKRAIRAMKDIVRAGYISVGRKFRVNEETGQITGLPSLRTFLPKFYIELNVKAELWTQVFSQREWARARAEKKTTKQDRKKQRAMIGMFKETIGSVKNTASKIVNQATKTAKTIFGTVKSAKPALTNEQADANMAHQKRLMDMASAAFKRDGTYGIMAIYKALIEENPPPH